MVYLLYFKILEEVARKRKTVTSLQNEVNEHSPG